MLQGTSSKSVWWLQVNAHEAHAAYYLVLSGHCTGISEALRLRLRLRGFLHVFRLLHQLKVSLYLSTSVVSALQLNFESSP